MDELLKALAASNSIREVVTSVAAIVAAQNAAHNTLADRVTALENIEHNGVDLSPFETRIATLENGAAVDLSPFVTRIETLEQRPLFDAVAVNDLATRVETLETVPRVETATVDGDIPDVGSRIGELERRAGIIYTPPVVLERLRDDDGDGLIDNDFASRRRL